MINKKANDSFEKKIEKFEQIFRYLFFITLGVSLFAFFIVVFCVYWGIIE